MLASSSKRRYELLGQVGCVPDVVMPSNVDEEKLLGETPKQLTSRLAMLKNQTVFDSHSSAIVLAADTVVALGRRTLNKPGNPAEAARMLEMLSGRRHRVYTSVCIRYGDRMRQVTVMTLIKFKRLQKSDILDYLESDEWEGKAGSYAIQGRAAAFVMTIIGSYSNVVGLPLYETCSLLKNVGYRFQHNKF